MEENKSQSFARRDRLLEIQKEAQELWQKQKINEMNPSDNPKKYMITFPYPYMNGKLHLGHAFSMSKCEFTARYKQLKGYNVLFPFSFHCTGMPITAAANRLKKEIQTYGIDNIPTEKSSQCQILKDMGVDLAIIPKFQDPYYWLQYFPNLGKSDLIDFGLYADFRRSFITTDYNPYYDKFIQWQFNTLKKHNRVIFGKRPSIYSIEDGQMCADHDRREGEGVDPQEYTLIKLRVLDNSKLPSELKDKTCYLVAATLRPETMYGQTNCFILPSGEYGAFEMKKNEVFICSERSALNMAYQDITKTAGKIEKICNISGEMLIGCPLSSPLTSYSRIYCYPMMTISMGKGTGIVTSVPSDSPDDFAALRDLKSKKQLREKYNLTDEMVLPFDPIPIINIEGYGSLAAEAACDEFKIQSQNDKEKLLKAKEKVYKLGFYDGVFIVPEYAGKKVQEVKTVIRDLMIAKGDACQYFEPENLVVSRLGDECVVALCDQWYIPYGDQEWKQPILEHLKSDNFNGFNPNTTKNLIETVDWLKQWGCSRSFGLGTKLPWDPQYLIESLSDSTIYMAYYTISHHLQSDMEGHQVGPMGIKAEELDDSFFDYVFLNKESQCKIDRQKLEHLRKEFMYWYPMDLRCSGKDLIKNHLTMSLFNHQAVFQDSNMIPKAFFCNGYVQVNGEKMSKSKGNFITMEGMIKSFGSDASRVALASCGDYLDDANFENATANSAILHLSQLEVLIQDFMKNLDSYRNNDEGDEKNIFYDRIFESQMNQYMKLVEQSYEQMRFRDTIKDGFYQYQHLFNSYKLNLKGQKFNRQLIEKYVMNSLLILYPITPHFCEIMYQKYIAKGENKSISQERWPENITFDNLIIKKNEYIENVYRNIRLAGDKIRVQNQKKKIQNPTSYKNVNVIYALNHQQWQINTMNAIREVGVNSENKVVGDWRKLLKESVEPAIIKKAMAFGQQICDEIRDNGGQVIEKQSDFLEKDLLLFVEVIYKLQEQMKKEANSENIRILEINECQDFQNFDSLLSSVTPGKVHIIIE